MGWGSVQKRVGTRSLKKSMQRNGREGENLHTQDQYFITTPQYLQTLQPVVDVPDVLGDSQDAALDSVDAGCDVTWENAYAYLKFHPLPPAQWVQTEPTGSGGRLKEGDADGEFRDHMYPYPPNTERGRGWSRNRGCNRRCLRVNNRLPGTLDLVSLERLPGTLHIVSLHAECAVCFSKRYGFRPGLLKQGCG